MKKWELIWHGNEKYPYPLSVLSKDKTMWICRGGQVSTKANAQLIASAPELLEACKLAMKCTEVTKETLDDLTILTLLRLQQAITKAEWKEVE